MGLVARLGGTFTRIDATTRRDHHSGAAARNAKRKRIRPRRSRSADRELLAQGRGTARGAKRRIVRAATWPTIAPRLHGESVSEHLWHVEFVGCVGLVLIAG